MEQRARIHTESEAQQDECACKQVYPIGDDHYIVLILSPVTEDDFWVQAVSFIGPGRKAASFFQSVPGYVGL